MSFLLSALAAPMGWLSWGLLAGPAGLILMGAGLLALTRLTGPEVDDL